MVTGSLECGTAGTVWLYRRSWWLFLLQDIGSCVVVGFAAHVGAFEFEVSGGPGDAAEGAVGDELAAGAHVPLPGFALAGDERGPGPVPGFHDLEDEDAVGGCGRGGQEVVEDEQFHAFELVDLTVALALAFEPGAVDLFEHVLRSDVAVRDAVAEGGVAERLADVALVGPGAGYDDQGLPVPYPSAGREPIDPVAAELAFGWVLDALDAGVLVFEPRLPDQPFDLAVASGDGLGVEHELDLLLESHVVHGFVVDDLAQFVAHGVDWLQCIGRFIEGPGDEGVTVMGRCESSHVIMRRNSDTGSCDCTRTASPRAKSERSATSCIPPCTGGCGESATAARSGPSTTTRPSGTS